MAKKTGGLGTSLGSVLGNTGKGVSALIGGDNDVVAAGSSSMDEIPLEEIEPNPDQPRKNFKAEALSELSESIKQIGVIQPITVRKIDNHKYIIIAGERRYRAAKLAKLTTIPAYVRTTTDEEMMEMALVENIQREDLNAIEVALSYQSLMEVCKYTPEQLSARIGKSRSTVVNYLRLLRLPAEIQVGLKDKKLDMGHARSLITIEDPAVQLDIYNQIQKNDLSVRKVENIVKDYKEKKEKGDNSSADAQNDNESNIENPNESNEIYNLLKDRLVELFKTKVEIKSNGKGKGKVTIPFKNDEQFETIIEVFDMIKQDVSN